MKKVVITLMFLCLSTIGVMCYNGTKNEAVEVKAEDVISSDTLEVTHVPVEQEVVIIEETSLEAQLKETMTEINSRYPDMVGLHDAIVSGQIFKAVNIEKDLGNNVYLATFMDETVALNLLCPPDGEGEICFNLFSSGETMTMEDGTVLRVYDEIDGTTMNAVLFDYDEYRTAENNLIEMASQND